MNVLIFGGTTEGRVLAQELLRRGVQVTVSVATPLGKEELSELKGLTIWVGRKTAQEMSVCVKDFDLCIDATHPYAVEATTNIREACNVSGVSLRRLLRQESRETGTICVASCAQAAEFLAGQRGNVLLTTGAKELSAFSGLDPRRIFARVLPCHESLAACEQLGLPHRNILALQGPFGQKMNEAMLEQYHIRWLVTKDGGRAGGFEEKIRAAQKMGASVILVSRPADAGQSLEEILEEVGRMLI